MEMWWLIWGCGGSYGNVVAHMKMWWLIGDVVVNRRCGGSLEMWWLIGDVVAH